MREPISGILLDEECSLSLGQLCRACSVHAEVVIELVEEGVIEPSGGDLTHWRFPPSSLDRVLRSIHLQRDLGINAAGAALVLDLLEEIETLRTQLDLYRHG